MSIIYGIIAIIVMIIGFVQIGDSFDFDNFTVNEGAFYLGVIILIIGFFLFFVGFFAAFLYAGTRGVSSSEPLGFVDAYVETFKLIAELAIAIIIAIVLFILGGIIGGGLGGLFLFLGFVTLWLFPSAALFYVVNYLGAR